MHVNRLTPRRPPSDGEEPQLGQLCDALPDLFPRPRTLYLSPHGSISRGLTADHDHNPVVAAATQAFLPSVDMETLRGRLPEETEMSVGVPPWFWQVLLDTLDRLGDGGWGMARLPLACPVVVYDECHYRPYLLRDVDRILPPTCQ